MNPLSLRATNYRTFEALELDLPEGCLAVVGENGAGKSSVVNVIDLALFGPESRSLADYLTDDAAGTELEVELTFEHAGETYRVRRGFSAKGRGKTTLDFEREDLDGDPMPDGQAPPMPQYLSWTPLTRETQKETQAAIEQTLGLARETFRASAFLAQGDGAAFTEAQPRERKKILAEVLGLGTWERLLEAARSDKRTADRELAELAGRIALLEESGADTAELASSCERLRSLCSELEREHASRRRELDDTAVAVQEAERAEATYREARAALEAAQARYRERLALVERAEKAAAEAEAIRTWLRQEQESHRVAELEDELATLHEQRERRREAETIRDRYLADAEDARRQAERLASERANVETDLARLREQAAALNDPAQIPHCPTCEQELRGEAFETALARIREARDDAERRVAAYEPRIEEQEERVRTRSAAAMAREIPAAPEQADIDALTFALRRAREAELEVARQREKLAGLEAQMTEGFAVRIEVANLRDAVDTAQETLAAYPEPEPGAADALRAKALDCQAHVEAVGGRLDGARRELVRCEAALERAEKIALDLEAHAARREQVQGELDLLALLERAYGRDGIPALIVEVSAIPQIETEANRILAELGTSYRVELRTQRELKGGDGLADTLDVVIVTEVGSRAYETFSGSEKARINIALRLALARLLAHRRGAESRVLILDEVEYLDEANQSRLADVVLGLRDEFQKVLVVSHANALRDAFDNVIAVEKIDGRSRVAA